MNRVLGWIDDRIDIAGIKRGLLDRKMPGGLTWWHTLGSATLTVFLVQVVTGIVLAMYYSPSPDHAYDSIRYLEKAVISGATLRGIHHWGASAMVILVLAHMIRVFSMGAYKYPREINWVLGVFLLFIVLGFSFTGYLLPWDQKAYWATQVGTNIAGTTPVVGPMLVKLLRGGGQLGAATLERFFALHVLLLPMMLVVVVMLHLALVIRQGIAPRTAVLETDAPSRTTDAAYPEYYETRYAKSKGAGVPFWPNIIYKDVLVGVVVVAILVILARVTGAGLESPADPSDTLYVPRPEWYFLPLFQLLKLVPGSWESAVAVGLPSAIVLVLLLLPFFDRRSIRSLSHRPIAIVSMTVVLAGSGLLIGSAVREEPASVVVPESSRPLSSIERAGRVLFQSQQCSSCHFIAGQKAIVKKSDTPDAPDLTAVGLKHSTAWMHSFIEDPLRFHPESKMPAFGPPTLTHEEIEEITRYLTTLRGPNGATAKPDYKDTFPEPLKPKEIKP
jgi:ubiquinol-cytochrome c reductase cytochrome b subunit